LFYGLGGEHGATRLAASNFEGKDRSCGHPLHEHNMPPCISHRDCNANTLGGCQMGRGIGRDVRQGVGDERRVRNWALVCARPVTAPLEPAAIIPAKDGEAKEERRCLIHENRLSPPTD